MTPPHRLLFVGFGGVGQALADLLRQRRGTMPEFRIVGVLDRSLGCIRNAAGLDPTRLLDAARQRRDLSSLNGDAAACSTDVLDFIQGTPADTVIEVTDTDGCTGEPAIAHCAAAFGSGKNVVTSNKGPVALAYADLQRLAERHGVDWRFEGTVMSGTPVLRLAETGLAQAAVGGVQAVRGILNGTCNYMLARMELGCSYESALRDAQEHGYAEADPVGDVDGGDAQLKIVILANRVMGASLLPSDVPCRGIRGLAAKDVRSAAEEGRPWRLVARAWRGDGTAAGGGNAAGGRIHACVEPVRLEPDDPLVAVQGAGNGITFETGWLGAVTLTGPGAGCRETASALLADLLDLAVDAPMRSSARAAVHV